MSKEDFIYNYSNPEIVERQASIYFPNDFDLKISTRKDKKYMIKGGFTNYKWVHFGAWGMEDFTKHKNKERKKAFQLRNHKWKNMPENSPAYISYYLLW
jgi:hypothetical protein